MSAPQTQEVDDKNSQPIVPFSLHRLAFARDGREGQAGGPLEEPMGIPRPQGVIRRTHPERSGVPLEAGLMDELTVAKFLKYDAEKVAVVEIPGGTCEVYRSECGYMVHLDRGAQLHRLIPCASRARLFEAIRQNLGSGPFAELSWKLVGKIF
jgi:hypothetical protein